MLQLREERYGDVRLDVEQDPEDEEDLVLDEDEEDERTASLLS